MVAVGQKGSSAPFTFSTKYFQIEFNPDGAGISSFKLKEHLDNGQPVELLFRSENSNDAFLLYAGNDKTNPMDANFRYQISGNKVIFTQEFALLSEDGKSTGSPFTLTKTYTFGDEDYLFQVDIATKNSENKAVPLSFENFAYTLAFEPQMGPSFSSLDNNTNIEVLYKEDGSSRKIRSS